MGLHFLTAQNIIIIVFYSEWLLDFSIYFPPSLLFISFCIFYLPTRMTFLFPEAHPSELLVTSSDTLSLCLKKCPFHFGSSEILRWIYFGIRSHLFLAHGKHHSSVTLKGQPRLTSVRLQVNCLSSQAPITSSLYFQCSAILLEWWTLA